MMGDKVWPARLLIRALENNISATSGMRVIVGLLLEPE
jgi:hypothetical protein